MVTVKDLNVLLTWSDHPHNGLHVRLFRPDDDEPFPIPVYIHGGDIVYGDLDTHDSFCRRIADRTPSVVLTDKFRLSSEVPFPAALHHAYDGDARAV